MGYSHHMTGQKVLTEESVRDIRKIMNTSGVELGDWEGRPGTTPDVSPSLISFNGMGEGGHETFTVNITDTGFNSCKTARKPYDKVVCAVMLRIREDSPGLAISGNGDWDDWADGRALFLEALGRPTKVRNLDK